VKGCRDLATLQPDISADMESYGHIQMLVQARRCHVFDLAEDGGLTDFNKILGDH
jgi:hypothetical protein